MNRLGLLLLTTVGVAPAQAQRDPPPSSRIGTVRFSTSCDAATRAGFNRAVALQHSFAFGPAADGFNAVLRLDPRCAMAYWGLALTAWGNPFAAGVKPPAQIRRGLDAVQQARAAGPRTDRERGYIEAIARLYERADSVDQPTRLLSYRDAMAELAAGEPADTEAAIFHALAAAAAADPTDKAFSSQLAAGATLERLFAVLPDHPGLAHYIIHAYDVPPLAGRAIRAAGRYAGIAPEMSHALHMPSHTFTRVGDWSRSIDANVASAAAARREHSGSEELHASDYRAYAYLQTGQDREARRLVDSLPSLVSLFDPTAVGSAAPPAAGYYAIAAIPARYALERGAWAEAARLELHPSPVPFADAVTVFARALGAARTGDTTAARIAAEALAGLRDRLVERREAYWSRQVEIQRRGAQAWLLLALGQNEGAVAAMRTAAAMEDSTEKNAITPGPLAPARELLGEMLLALHQPGPALAEFQATLRHEPNRFRAVAGAARAAREAGDVPTAREYSKLLLNIAAPADRPGRPELVEAREAAARP